MPHASHVSCYTQIINAPVIKSIRIFARLVCYLLLHAVAAAYIFHFIICTAFLISKSTRWHWDRVYWKAIEFECGLGRVREQRNAKMSSFAVC